MVLSDGTLNKAAMGRDYCEELRDSLDLVPIGAWHGNGRKVGWYSPFLLAAWDPDTEEFQSVCRCMSGFSDAFYAQVCLLATLHHISLPDPYNIFILKVRTSTSHQFDARPSQHIMSAVPHAPVCFRGEWAIHWLLQAKERLDQHRIDERKDYYNTNERPSVWFKPTEVWELRGADLTLSAVHKAAFGLIHPTRGVSLRWEPSHHSLVFDCPTHYMPAACDQVLTCSLSYFHLCIEDVADIYLCSDNVNCVQIPTIRADERGQAS